MIRASVYLTHILNILVDSIFPPRASDVFVRTLNESEFPFNRQQSVSAYGNVITLAQFAHPTVKTVIHEIKFHQNVAAARLFKKALTDAITEVCLNSDDLIVPIPLHSSRLLERGCNQVELVLKSALSDNRQLLARVRSNILKRTKKTVEQTSLSRAERVKNVKGAFSVEISLEGKHIILVDDVYTTGATCTAAAETLHTAGACKITCIALSHA